MMNLVALSLVAASLAAASVWSPPPHPPDHRVVKEGRRVIMVEYEREGVEKPVLDDVHHEEHSFLPPLHEAKDKAKEKLKEAASVFPNIGQGVSGPGDAAGGHDAPGTTKEMICDAYGKCKEKISSVFGKAKDKASEAGEAPRETYEKAAEVGDEAARKVKRVGKEVEGKVQEKAKTAREEAAGAKKMAADKAKAVGEKVVEGLDVAVDKAKRVGESAAEKAKSVGEKVVEGVEGGAKMAVDKAKQAVGGKLSEEMGGAAGKAKRMGEDIAGNLSEGLKAAEAVGARAKKNLTEIGRQAWEVAGDTWSYVASPESLRTVAGLVHLLAFSATYGTCMWVTFVSSHLLARSLPRQQFGLVQSRIYPVYFRAMAYGVGLAWLAHLLSKKKVPTVGLSGYNLLATLGFVLANLLYMEPRASKVMFERLKLEKEEGKGRDAADLTAEPIAVTSKVFPDTSNEVGRRTTMVATARVAEQEEAKSKMAKLNRRLKSLNTYSSFLNVLALMGLTWHLVYLARRLQMCS